MIVVSISLKYFVVIGIEISVVTDVPVFTMVSVVVVVLLVGSASFL